MNNPSLADGGFNTSPIEGDYYVVGVAGTTTIDGNSTWAASETRPDNINVLYCIKD